MQSESLSWLSMLMIIRFFSLSLQKYMLLITIVITNKKVEW
jgi:hypothetical protein